MIIPVDYPFGGRRLLLRWWTEHERGHVVIAASESALLATARRVFHDNPDAEIKDALDVEIVAPSKRLEQLAAVCIRREEVFHFHYMVCVHVDAAGKAGFPLPSPFARCETFEPDDEESSPDSWARDNHFGCRHCRSRVRLVGLTPEELFDRYAVNWAEVRPGRAPDVRIRRNAGAMRHVSHAEPAGNDEPLWWARKNFGHHAGGVEFEEVDIDAGVTTDHGYTPACLTGDAMFFFRRLGEVAKDTRAKIEAALAVERKAHEEKYEKSVKERHEDREKEERSGHEAIVRFFAERS
jgi:hypothetical protein